MNTTSMEFVIAQNNQTDEDAKDGEGGKEKLGGKNSPLVLSEFMGISKHMEDALLVNPWNLGVRLIIPSMLFEHMLIRLQSGCSSCDQ